MAPSPLVGYRQVARLEGGKRTWCSQKAAGRSGKALKAGHVPGGRAGAGQGQEKAAAATNPSALNGRRQVPRPPVGRLRVNGSTGERSNGVQSCHRDSAQAKGPSTRGHAFVAVLRARQRVLRVCHAWCCTQRCAVHGPQVKCPAAEEVGSSRWRSRLPVGGGRRVARRLTTRRVCRKAAVLGRRRTSKRQQTTQQAE